MLFGLTQWNISHQVGRCNCTALQCNSALFSRILLLTCSSKHEQKSSGFARAFRFQIHWQRSEFQLFCSVLFFTPTPPETQYGSCESWNRKRLLSVCSWYRSMFLADNNSMKCFVSLEQPELQLLLLKPASKN